MNKAFLRTLGFAAIAIALLLTCVEVMADAYAFSPPSGWHGHGSSSSGHWVAPSGMESVSLVTAQVSGDLSAFVNHELGKQRATYPSQRIYNNKNYSLCGRHIGRYVIWTSSNGGHDRIHEQVITAWNTDGYVLTYVRPANHPPSNAARASLLSICAVYNGTIPPGGVPVQTAPPPVQPNATVAPAAPVNPSPTPYVYPSLVPRYAPVIPM